MRPAGRKLLEEELVPFLTAAPAGKQKMLACAMIIADQAIRVLALFAGKLVPQDGQI